MACASPTLSGSSHVGKKRRNELAAAETSLCYLTRGKFGEDQNDDGFIDTRWVELEELYDNAFMVAQKGLEDGQDDDGDDDH